MVLRDLGFFCGDGGWVAMMMMWGLGSTMRVCPPLPSPPTPPHKCSLLACTPGRQLLALSPKPCALPSAMRP